MDLIYGENRIYAKNETGKIVAEVTFPDVSQGIVNINHTFVDDSLRGQGVAGKLLEAACDTLRKQDKKAKLTCSYAVSWFAKHPDCADVVLDKAPV